MYEIKITVEILGLPEAINHLADALTAGCSHIVCNQNGENNHHIDNAGTVNINPGVNIGAAHTAPENPTAPASAPTIPANAEAASAAQTGPAPTSSLFEEKSYTLDDLSKAGAALIDQGKMPQLIELLGKYGVQAITQLNPGMYSTVAADLKAIGAQL